MVTIIINPIAGGSRRQAGGRVELARAVAAELGEAADVFVTEQPGHARRLAAAAREYGARVVVAWGGDGTINEVASELSFRNVPVGIVPAGSGNGLARELGLNQRQPAEALRTALKGTPRAIDIGEIEGRLFTNVAGIGLDAHVAEKFNHPDNLRRGSAAYIALTARALIEYRPQRYAIETASGRREVTALLVVIANGAQFGNGIRIAPGARFDDGALDLVVVSEVSRPATLCRVPWLLAGRIDRVSAWSSTRTDAVTVRSDSPILFHVDGEIVRGGDTVHARVHPGALKVVGPRT